MMARDSWVETFTGLHGASRITMPDSSSPWTGRLDWHRSGAYGVALCYGFEQRMTRDSKHVRVDPRGTYELLVPVAGTASMEQDRSSAELRPGVMALCDVDRPFIFTHDAGFRSVAFIVAAPDMPAPGLLDATGGLGRVVEQMVHTLHAEHDRMAPAAFDRACDNLLDLVGVVADGESETAPAGQRATVEVAIRRHVRQHAADHGLDVSAVAKELGWSPRYIQQVLRAAGTTPRELIRHERLRLARERLANPKWASSSVGRIAHSCGFGSQAVFATAFRQRFGMTPSEARARQDRPYARLK
jgi:AraC-like DNA-binding protein